MPSWLDDWKSGRGAIGGEAREALEMLVDEQNMPSPDSWASYEIFMDADGHGAAIMIVSDDGTEYELRIDGIDLYDLDSWDYVWDIWDWIIQNFPDVDLDVHYG